MRNHVLFLVLVLACAPVFAQNTPQQDKMKACNADAAKKELKGDQRKAFMKDCLAALPLTRLTPRDAGFFFGRGGEHLVFV